MVEFCDGEKMTVSYTNEDGGSSRITMKKSLADAIESITGQKFSEWVQTQHDDIIAGHERFNKYIRVHKIEGRPLSRRKIGDIIRMVAFDVIPDCDFK